MRINRQPRSGTSVVECALVYPSVMLNVTGNGSNDVIGSQYISYNLVSTATAALR